VDRVPLIRCHPLTPLGFVVWLFPVSLTPCQSATCYESSWLEYDLHDTCVSPSPNERLALLLLQAWWDAIPIGSHGNEDVEKDDLGEAHPEGKGANRGGLSLPADCRDAQG